jgi:hypothetical protein
MLLDSIFGVENFRNEIVWQRFNFHADAHRYGRVHDILLFYTKTDNYFWKTQYGEYKEKYKKSHFYNIDPVDGRNFRLSDSTAKGQGPLAILTENYCIHLTGHIGDGRKKTLTV